MCLLGIADYNQKKVHNESVPENAINRRWQEIYSIFKEISNPKAALLYTPLTYLYHDEMILKAKKQIFREIAVMLSKASLIIKQLCFLDYAQNFIDYFEITNVRKIRFIVRKCLTFRRR